ncbi:hypothetical protein Gasu2_16480 [Galdieria sulphuraria]|nr:hypothetical protein Gasu2_16480 [Galdieria sulphuraria]
MFESKSFRRRNIPDSFPCFKKTYQDFIEFVWLVKLLTIFQKEDWRTPISVWYTRKHLSLHVKMIPLKFNQENCCLKKRKPIRNIEHVLECPRTLKQSEKTAKS